MSADLDGLKAQPEAEWHRLRAREELMRWRMKQDEKALRKSTEAWQQACRELVAYDRKLMADA